MTLSSIKIRTHVFLLFTLMTLDQYLKSMALKGGFGQYKHGVMLGGILPLDSLNLNLGMVTFSILFLFLYFLLLIQMPKNIAGSRLGLTLLTSGIVSNGLDRLFRNKIVDFKPLGMNFADFCLIAGIILFVWLYVKDHILDKRKNYRKSVIVLPKDQIRLASIFSLLIMTSGLILGIFGAMFLNIHFADYHLNGHLLLRKYIFLHFSVTVTLSLMFFIFCLFFSHRLAGPVFGFLSYLRRNNGVMKGEFRSRDRDFFTAFEEIDKEMSSKKN